MQCVSKFSGVSIVLWRSMKRSTKISPNLVNRSLVYPSWIIELPPFFKSESHAPARLLRLDSVVEDY